MTTATYETTITVETYTYTATMVTEAGETTATLTGRSDLDCPRRREIACPGNCKCWYQLHYNINLQAYEPIHCNNCCIALYDIHFVPAVVATPEPVAVEETAQVQTVEQVAAGIEHYKSVCQKWDNEFDAPYIAPNEELSAQTLELIAADTTPLNLDEPLALEQPPVWMQPENATEAVSAIQKSIVLPGEVIGSFIRLATTIDRPEYALKADQTFYLVHSESESKKASKPTYWIVTWDYALCRWTCPCGDPHHTCKHTRPVNQDCRDRAKQQQEAA